MNMNNQKFSKQLNLRECAVCGSMKKNLLYKQKFSKIDNSNMIDGYDVVSCLNCGFTFADKLPIQEKLDEYYHKMSKYEYFEPNREGSVYDETRFRKLMEIILPYIHSSDSHILDVGCATGKLLSLFKERGYNKVIGLDPSSGCAEAAKKLYGVEVVVAPISKFSFLQKKFDCIILAGVLEHILDLEKVLSRLLENLSKNGIICIQVPDASRFFLYPDAPFQQFSTEHIDFFSSTSLGNLMAKMGGKEVKTVEEEHPQSTTTIMPTITSIFKKKLNSSLVFIYDKFSEIRLRKYIQQSTETENSIRELISKLVFNQTPMIVWGTGTHTLHLLESTSLSKAKIIAFIDENQSYQKLTLRGIPILHPDSLYSMTETILVSSRVYQQDIVHRIHKEFKLKNQIITLYHL